MNGWVKVHRKLVEWEWYKDSAMVHLFIHLLLNASNRDCKWKGVDIKRGQVVIGRKKLSADTGISEKKIRICLERLKTANVTDSEATNKFTIITILNYNEYQVNEEADGQRNSQQNGQQRASKGPAKGQKRATSEEGKEVKNISFSPKTMKPDWITEEDWWDIIAHRKVRKAASTERAFRLLVKELEKAVSAGFAIKECVDAMTSKNWIGFQAEWMSNLQGRQSHQLARDSEWM